MYVCKIEGPDDALSIVRINEALSKKIPIVIAFYMDGCGYCEELKPEWTAAAETVKHSRGYGNSPSIIALVNMSAMGQLRLETSHVYGFPHIVAVSNGQHQTTYPGARERSALSSWMMQHVSRGFGQERKRKPGKKTRKSKSKSGDKKRGSKHRKKSRTMKKTRKYRKAHIG